MKNAYFNRHIAIFYYSLVLSIVSAIQLFGKSVDYDNYIQKFGTKNISQLRANLEPGFIFLSSVNDYLFNSSIKTIFFITAFIALSLKFCAINKLAASNFIFDIAFVFYLLTFFWLHEYTQIRAAIAIGIYFNSLLLLRKNKIAIYCVYTIIATLFHYSGVIMLIFLLFVKIFNTKRKCLIIVLAAFLFAAVAGDVIGNQLHSLLFQMQVFIGLTKLGDSSNFISVFNLKYLSLLIVFCISCIFISDNKTDLLLLQSTAFGLCFFYYLHPVNLPVVSVRLAEFYTSIVIILVPNIMLRKFKEKYFLLFIINVFFLFYAYSTLKMAGILVK